MTMWTMCRRNSHHATARCLLLVVVVLVSLAVAAKKCPNCGKEYPDSDNYCADCVGPDGKPVKLAPADKKKPESSKSRRIQGEVVVAGDTLTILSVPAGAVIKLDGKVVGKTPDRIAAVAVGMHRVRLTCSGYSTYEVEVEVEGPMVPKGMSVLGPNTQGYMEFLWLRDTSVMVRIPAGEFWMGSISGTGDEDEHPQHKVYLGEFYIDKCEVTNRQYKRFCDATRRSYPPDPNFEGMPDYFVSSPSYPVVNVSWDDAEAYCAWVGKRLPTEAEWECAARGTSGRKYPWGSEEPDLGGGSRANWNPENDTDGYSGDGHGFTSPVGTYVRGISPYGCLDMSGNVWEWCDDWYSGDCYGKNGSAIVDSNPTGPDSGAYRVLRGGSWADNADRLRTAYRYRGVPADHYGFIGFRTAVSF